MDPTVLYVLLVCLAVSVCTGAVFAWRPPERGCLNCGKPTPIQGRRCKHCGY